MNSYSSKFYTSKVRKGGELRGKCEEKVKQSGQCFKSVLPGKILINTKKYRQQYTGMTRCYKFYAIR